MNWPCHKADSNHSSTPSPYDIFEIEKDGAYSKHKFYELVKMYHPDRHSHHSGIPDHPIASLPQVECVERYRLVVQAHEILSDPVKRKAYDACGAGWGEQATKAYTGTSATPRYSARDEDSPFGNATWEDWERWYARTSDQHHQARRGPQAYEGIYFNPNAFASFVIVMAVISGVLQATHAGQYTGSIEERAAAFTAQTHQFMTERKQDNTEYSSTGFSGHGFHGNAPKMGTLADGRIRHFLQRRDPNRHGLKDEEQEMYRKHFAGQPLPLATGVKKGVTDTKDDNH
jgi:curved DNA-binding protein CbpA